MGGGPFGDGGDLYKGICMMCHRLRSGGQKGMAGGLHPRGRGGLAPGSRWNHVNVPSGAVVEASGGRQQLCGL